MGNDKRARAMRAVFGNARDHVRFRPSEINPTARTVVKHMPSIGFCSTDYACVPVSMPRITALHGEYEVAA